MLPRTLYPIIFVAFLACSAEEESPNTSDPANRGGPESLLGFDWKSEVLSVSGINLQTGFRFDKTTITASNTCDGTLTATVTAPVQYRYRASVAATVKNEESAEGQTCFVAINSGEFDFVIVDDKLHVDNNGETTVFSPKGSVAGLYGTWQNKTDIATLSWSMGNGRMTANAACTNGVSASVSTNTNFQNFFDIREEASKSVEDEFGLECNIAIASGELEYYFDKQDLVMIFGNDKLVFKSQ